MKSQIGQFGLPLNTASFKGRVSPDFQYPSLIKKISALGLLFQDPSCQILHDGRNRRAIFQFSFEKGQTINIFVKEFNVKGLDKLKTLFFSSKAAKAWRGSLILVKKGIHTPEPVAYFEGKRAPFIKQSFYFSLFVQGAEEIRHLLRRLPDEELKRILQFLACYLYSCHEKRILHRDLSDGNILIRKNANQEYKFFLIDTNRVRLKRKMATLKRIKNLIRLGIPPPLQRFFLEEYLGPAQLRYIGWIWYKFNKNLYTGYVHLKGKLRIRQLIQKLGVQ